MNNTPLKCANRILRSSVATRVARVACSNLKPLINQQQHASFFTTARSHSVSKLQNTCNNNNDNIPVRFTSTKLPTHTSQQQRLVPRSLNTMPFRFMSSAAAKTAEATSKKLTISYYNLRLGDAKNKDEAMKIFAESKQVAPDVIKPNAATYIYALEFCIKEDDLVGAGKILDEAASRNIILDIPTYVELIRLCGNSPYNYARKSLDLIKEAYGDTGNPKHGNAKELLSKFEALFSDTAAIASNMRWNSARTTKSFIESIINADYAKNRDVVKDEDQGLSFAEADQLNLFHDDIEPGDTTSSNPYLLRAAEFVHTAQKVGVKATEQLYSALIDASLQQEDTEHAKKALEELEDQNLLDAKTLNAILKVCTNHIQKLCRIYEALEIAIAAETAAKAAAADPGTATNFSDTPAAAPAVDDFVYEDEQELSSKTNFSNDNNNNNNDKDNVESQHAMVDKLTKSILDTVFNKIQSTATTPATLSNLLKHMYGSVLTDVVVFSFEVIHHLRVLPEEPEDKLNYEILSDFLHSCQRAQTHVEPLGRYIPKIEVDWALSQYQTTKRDTTIIVVMGADDNDGALIIKSTAPVIRSMEEDKDEEVPDANDDGGDDDGDDDGRANG